MDATAILWKGWWHSELGPVGGGNIAHPKIAIKVWKPRFLEKSITFGIQNQISRVYRILKVTQLAGVAWKLHDHCDMISTIVNSCKSKRSHFACGFNDDFLYQLFVAGGSAISVEMENRKGLVDRISVEKNRLDDLAGLMVLSESGEANGSSSPTFSQKGWNLVMNLCYPSLLHAIMDCRLL